MEIYDVCDITDCKEEAIFITTDKQLCITHLQKFREIDKDIKFELLEYRINTIIIRDFIKQKGSCKHELCNEAAIYGLQGYMVEYCGIHKLDGMVTDPDLCKCISYRCKNVATHGLAKQLPEYCMTHKLKGMLKRRQPIKCCERECINIAYYNYKGLPPILCETHMMQNMVKE